MEKNEKPVTICRSVFKSGEDTISKSEYTKKWIELINILEKNKGVVFCERQ